MNTLASSIISRTDALRGTTPANAAPEKRIVRTGSLARYKAAIADLKTQLGLPDVWVVIAGSEFSITHGITSYFLFVLAKAGIIKRRRHKRAGWQYQGTTKLMHLTPEVAQGLIRGVRKEVVPPAPEPVAIKPVAEMVEPKPIYLLGLVRDKSATFHLGGYKIFSDLEEATKDLEYAAKAGEPGEKAILVQVIRVVEAVRAIQESTL